MALSPRSLSPSPLHTPTLRLPLLSRPHQPSSCPLLSFSLPCHQLIKHQTQPLCFLSTLPPCRLGLICGALSLPAHCSSSLRSPLVRKGLGLAFAFHLPSHRDHRGSHRSKRYRFPASSASRTTGRVHTAGSKLLCRCAESVRAGALTDHL